MSLAEWSGDRTEYAVAYDKPEVYAGIVGHVCLEQSRAEAIARDEERHPDGDFKCHVVARTVTYSDWRPVVCSVTPKPDNQKEA